MFSCSIWVYIVFAEIMNNDLIVSLIMFLNAISDFSKRCPKEGAQVVLISRVLPRLVGITFNSKVNETHLSWQASSLYTFLGNNMNRFLFVCLSFGIHIKRGEYHYFRSVRRGSFVCRKRFSCLQLIYLYFGLTILIACTQPQLMTYFSCNLAVAFWLDTLNLSWLL